MDLETPPQPIPVKRMPTLVTRRKPSPSRVKIATPSQSPPLSAEAEHIEQTMRKLRESMAARKLKQFMKKPDVSERRKSVFLKNICSDSNVCIGFGIEQKKIYNFFNGFLDKQYMKLPIEHVQSTSVNGSVAKIAYERDGYLSHAVLKTSRHSAADNLVYEYMVGKYMNTMSKFYPGIIQTYNLVEYADVATFNMLSNRIPINTNAELSNLNMKSISRDDATEICTNPARYALLLQNLVDSQDFKTIMTNTADPLVDEKKILLLHQLYFTLSQLKDNFTHYDLHYENVLCYSVGTNKYIEFNYHMNDGTVVSYNYDRLAYMIDFGRSYFNESTRNNSVVIYNKICNNPTCLNCGVNSGLGFLGPNTTGIISQQRNMSADLRLMRIAYYNFGRIMRNNGTEIGNIPGKQIIFNSVYTTPEITAPGVNTVNNVSDALNELTRFLSYCNRQMTQFYINNGYTKMGTLHIYEDGRTPMKYMPETTVEQVRRKTQKRNVVQQKIQERNEKQRIKKQEASREKRELEKIIEKGLKTYSELPNAKNELIRAKNILLSKYPKDPLIEQIDETLNEDLLCNQLYQLPVTDAEMMEKINWTPLDKKGCSLNVLTFLDIIERRSASCMNVDKRFTMDDIKDLIVKNQNINYSIQNTSIPYSADNLQSFISYQLQNENVTIARVKNDSRGRTLIFYKINGHLWIIDPEKKIFISVLMNVKKNTLEVIKSLTDASLESKEKLLLNFINDSDFLEFFIINPNMDVEERPRTFSPKQIESNMPIHTFMFIANGRLAIDTDIDVIAKQTLAFPFNHIVYFLDNNRFQNQIQEGTSIIDIMNQLKLRNTMNIVNATGKIEVYPMYWYWDENSVYSDELKPIVGMYHFVYDQNTQKMSLVEKIKGHELFVDKNTGGIKDLQYEDILREFNKYYNKNKNTRFKTIPRELIIMSILGLSSIPFKAPSISGGGSQVIDPATQNEMLEYALQQQNKYAQEHVRMPVSVKTVPRKYTYRKRRNNKKTRNRKQPLIGSVYNYLQMR